MDVGKSKSELSSPVNGHRRISCVRLAGNKIKKKKSRELSQPVQGWHDERGERDIGNEGD